MNVMNAVNMYFVFRVLVKSLLLELVELLLVLKVFDVFVYFLEVGDVFGGQEVRGVQNVVHNRRWEVQQRQLLLEFLFV